LQAWYQQERGTYLENKQVDEKEDQKQLDKGYQLLKYIKINPS
jgi:hypothetical protein